MDVDQLKTEDIKKILPKPSDVVQAMIDGLNRREEFGVTLNMSNFVSKNSDGVCFGCAATLTAMHAFDFPREQRFGLHLTEDSPLRAFESMVDRLRRGKLGSLLNYYGVGDYRNKVNRELCLALGFDSPGSTTEEEKAYMLGGYLYLNDSLETLPYWDTVVEVLKNNGL